MPTDLGRKYNLDWRGDPPHMLKPDIPVWYRFLEKWGEMFVNLYYDCLIGGPYMSEQELRDPLKKMWRVNLAKRADAIGETKNEVWLIEVASDPGLRTIGQIQVYHTLWLRDPKINKIEKLVIVCEKMQEDLLDAAGMHGIEVYIV